MERHEKKVEVDLRLAAGQKEIEFRIAKFLVVESG